MHISDGGCTPEAALADPAGIFFRMEVHRLSWRSTSAPPLRRFSRGCQLVRGGDPATSVFLINHGHVRTYLLGEDGQETTTAIIGARQIVGLSPLLGRPTHHAFAEALDDVEAWAWPADQLLKLLLVDRDLLGLVVGSLAQRLAQEVQLLADIALFSATERVAAVNSRHAALLDPPVLTHRALADLIGIRPETLSRTLHRRLPCNRPLASPCGSLRAERADSRSVRTESTLTYAPGQRVEAADTSTLCVFVVRSGVVRLFVEGSAQRQVGVDLVRGGEYFGLSAVHSTTVAPVAEALTEVSLSPVSPSRLLQLLDVDPREARGLLTQIGERLERVERRLHRARGPNAPARLANLLEELGDRFGEAQPDGCWLLPAGWTHAALGREIGLRRETVTRALRTLAGEGRVCQLGRRLMVHPATAVS